MTHPQEERHAQVADELERLYEKKVSALEAKIKRMQEQLDDTTVSGVRLSILFCMADSCCRHSHRRGKRS